MDEEQIETNIPYTSSSKYQVTFRDVIIRNLLKLGTLASVEFRGGYWQQKTKISKDGMAYSEKIYIPDSREEYSNAILFLHDILIPHFDKDMQKQSEDITKELNNLRIKCIDATSVDETKFLKLKKEESAILPMDTYKGDDKLIIESYRFAKLQKTRKLFQELSKFLKQWNYGAPKPIID